MGQTLVVEVSDDLFQVLKEIADMLGKTPDEVSAEWLAAAGERIVNDPLFQFAGAIRSNVPDWIDRHDDYLGQALAEKRHRGKEP